MATVLRDVPNITLLLLGERSWLLYFTPMDVYEPGLMKIKNTTPTPHDALFRQFLTQPDIARDFMAIHLPPSLRVLCDLSTLQLESGSFVEDDLRQYFSDVLYSLKTSSGKGYIHVLIEHQSGPDKHMAFRLMRYAVAAMHRHLQAGHKTLPLVIPMLFYTGKRSPYPYSLCWLDEFANPDIARALYTTAFPLVDVTIIPDDEIARHRSMAALTLLQKHIQSDAHAFVHKLAQRVPQHGEALMTIAEQLEQKGIEKGIVKGRKEEALKIAQTMLNNGLDRPTVIKMTGLTEEELAKLRHSSSAFF